MKHGLAILLASAVGCGTVFAQQATPPALKINGYTSVSAIGGKQSNRGNDKGGSPAQAQISASELGFDVRGRSAAGFEYRYYIGIESVPGVSPTISKNYVEFGGDFGVIQAGAVKGPEDTMHFNALNLTGGAGSIDGAFTSVYNMSAGVIDGVSQAGSTSKANKVVFYSPIVNGFQLGVGYTPEANYHGGKKDKNSVTRNVGGASDIYPGMKSSDGVRGRNNWTVGLKYNGQTGAWSYGSAVVWIRESNYLNQEKTLTRYKIRSTNTYSLSAFVGRDAWKVAAGWHDNGKSKLPREAGVAYKTDTGSAGLGDAHLGNAGKAWNVGAQYNLGAYDVAVTYFNTSRKTDAKEKATSDVVSLSLDYKALEGLKFFGEVDFIRSKTNKAVMDVAQASLGANSTTRAVGSNSGTMLVAGTKISF